MFLHRGADSQTGRTYLREGIAEVALRADWPNLEEYVEIIIPPDDSELA